MFNASTLLAEIGLYLTPLRARGMSATIINALKITALKIALSGEESFMILRTPKGETLKK